ncbi:MAG: HD domain-containing protein, partial [Lachnospiraceae bacterium]|nr:HD domain-containing protein [Lachnospiraceae bacterium]
YGPIHTVFYAMTFIYFIIGFTAIIYSYLKKKDVSRKIISLLFVPELVSVICFFFGKQITTTVELIPSCFVFAQIMYLFIAHYTCIYNVSDMAIDSLVQTGVTGFASFDFKLNYLGSNEMARSVFENINELTVDRPLDRNKELSDLFEPWIKRFSEDENDDKFYYSKGDNIYLVDINYLFHENKKIGYQMVITDDTKNQKYIELIDNYNSDLEKEVQQKTENLVKMHSNLIRSMAKLVESRDNSTGGHIIRTSDVVEILMDEIMQDKEFVKKNHIDENFKKNIIKAAPLHDIGKIAVDDDILKKPGRFTDEEFEKMKAHAPEGAKVLHSILADTDDEEFKVLAENVAHYHHERMDGSGYPDGLVGEQIPIESRIMAIADVYDALVSKRVYKDKMSFEKADSIMMESMGKHFDKELEKFYVSARGKIEEYYLAAGE